MTVRQNKFLFSVAAGIVALPILQLIPLPPSIWQALPGRDLVGEVDRAAGLGELWRPLTLTPIETRNSLFAALLPLAALTLGAETSIEARSRLLALVLVLGCISAVLGLAQVAAGESSWLYLFPISNFGSPVGLFANRNHQALLLALMPPMLLVLAVRGGLSAKVLAALGMCMVLPMVVLIGSRAGLIVAVLGLLASPLLLRLAPRGAPRSPVAAGRVRRGLAHFWLIALAAAASLAAFVAFGPMKAWDRLIARSGSGELRLQLLPTLTDLVQAYFPVGSGLGSFERVYKIAEPDALLSPNYVNHAHNDWIEAVVTGGAPAAAILTMAVVGFGVRAWQNLSSNEVNDYERLLARLGLLVVLLLGLASAFDYPLRTPAMAALFSIAVIWSGCSPAGTRPLPKTAKPL